MFQHFGHTPEFLVCEVADGKVVSSEIASSGGIGRGGHPHEGGHSSSGHCHHYDFTDIVCMEVLGHGLQIPNSSHR